MNHNANATNTNEAESSKFTSEQTAMGRESESEYLLRESLKFEAANANS